MSGNKMMQYTTKSGKVRVRTMPNSNEKSDLYNVLKNAVNVYTPIVKGLLQPQLVAERPAGDLERVLDFRKQQKTRFKIDKTQGVMVKEDIGKGEWILEITGRKLPLPLQRHQIGSRKRADLHGSVETGDRRKIHPTVLPAVLQARPFLWNRASSDGRSYETNEEWR
ncbi:hypothetical protein GCK72_012445 [Caenorhabditis remanei]|uniref:Uncharacterized protein n=1 Tax=Caenorhabditis remanei TaxID=31234 RepID=A0A6A5GNC8_CAERE|nr:hypothetical protein GCK72_012445 [Caenorhabditis remanei]KAF1755992.1 hypothetical protein GCK72_012445 [Caenorhabditis remanei]